MTLPYNPSEAGLPKWAQELLDRLRTENINLRAQTTPGAATVVKLQQDWFVLPGPAKDEPPIRVWILGSDGPQMIGQVAHGDTLAFQRLPAPAGPVSVPVKD